jgi:hypothetical protein
VQALNAEASSEHWNVKEPLPPALKLNDAAVRVVGLAGLAVIDGGGTDAAAAASTPKPAPSASATPSTPATTRRGLPATEGWLDRGLGFEPGL